MKMFKNIPAKCQETFSKGKKEKKQQQKFLRK